MKILIVRFSSIGDIVLTSPVIRCIKEQKPESEIHYLTKEKYQDVIKHNPNISKLWLLKRDYSQLISEMKYEHFDYIIDLHSNLRTSILKRKIKALSFTFDKINFKKWLIVNFKINKLPNAHIVDRYFETLKHFDISNDQKGLDYYISEPDKVNLSQLPNFATNSKIIAVAVGATHFTKQIPKEKLIEIIKNIDAKFVLLGGKEDINKAKAIAGVIPEKCINLCGTLSINQSASVVQQADVVLTSDTGLMHIAAAFKKNIISLWGNTIPEFGMFPYLPGDKSFVFEVKELRCRPCTKIGFNKCPKKHFKCMNDIDVASVVQKINLILEEKQI